MKTSFLRIAISSALIVGGSFAADASCKPDDVRGVADPDMLVVSEYHVAHSATWCPSRLEMGAGYRLSRSRQIWIWIRLEGGGQYLDRADARRPLAVRYFLRQSDNNFHPYRHATDIEAENAEARQTSAGIIRIEEARAESNGREDGRFDWRTRTATTALTRPGEYLARVVQGNKTICPVNGDHQYCGIRFWVN